MRFLRMIMILVFAMAITGFTACGDKSGSEQEVAKEQPVVEDITTENAEKKADEVLKEIEKL